MKKTALIKKVFCLFLLFLFPSISPADLLVKCPSSDAYLFFGNGMFTSLDSAEETRARLSQQAPRHTGYFVSYNKNELALIQIYEVLSQKVASEEIKEEGLLKLLLSGQLTNATRKIYSQQISKIFKRMTAADVDLELHITTYESLLKNNSRVHILAHSQGNFYANEAHAILENRGEINMDAFKILSIANPDRKVSGDGPYFTYKNDLIIKHIPYALPGNIQRNQPSGTNHGILSAYYRSDELLPTINGAIESIKKETQDVFINSEEAQKNIQWHRDSVMKECQDWFLRYVKVPKKFNIGECSTQCRIVGHEDMSNFHCPLQCDSLCCTREYGPWPHK